MRAVLVPLTLALLVAPASARKVANVDLPETVSEAGTTLHLNGAGVRTRFFFKVYAAGLYLRELDRDAAAIMSADEPKRIDLHMLRSLDARTIAESIAGAFDRNVGERRAALQDRLERLKRMFPSVREGDVVTLAFVPGRGTIVRTEGGERGVIDGKDFADALFAVWLGAAPVDGDLKRALLGG